MSGPTGRVIAFVDGFNVYHAIKESNDLKHLKWLNYRALCQQVLPNTVELTQVLYFTAFYYDDPDGVDRHKTYIAALRTEGVEPIYGKFKTRDRKCPLCKRRYRCREEKQTDVNVAVRILLEAQHDTFDTALLVTGDTDLIPVINAVQTEFPAKRVGVFQPPNRRAKELKDRAHFFRKMKRKHLETCQFPARIPVPGGAIECPDVWVPENPGPSTCESSL